MLFTIWRICKIPEVIHACSMVLTELFDFILTQGNPYFCLDKVAAFVDFRHDFAQETLLLYGLDYRVQIPQDSGLFHGLSLFSVVTDVIPFPVQDVLGYVS